MQRANLILCLFILAIVAACGDRDQSAQSSPDALKLTLTFDQETFSSFEEVSGWITVENVSHKSLLVNGRLAIAPVPWKPEFIECLLLISDDNGAIIPNGKLDITFPKEEFFIELAPGQSIDKKFTLRGIGFSASDFRNNEQYDAVAVYQNLLDVSVSNADDLVGAWKGEIRSAKATFQISP